MLSRYSGDLSRAPLIIQQVSLPACLLSKDLSQGRWDQGCEPASSAVGSVSAHLSKRGSAALSEVQHLETHDLCTAWLLNTS